MRQHTQHRRDGNHAQMLALARQLFPCVEDHSQQTVGYDLLIKNSHGRVFMIEIKDGSLPPSRRRLTPREDMMCNQWGSTYWVIEKADDLVALLKLR